MILSQARGGFKLFVIYFSSTRETELEAKIHGWWGGGVVSANGCFPCFMMKWGIT